MRIELDLIGVPLLNVTQDTALPEHTVHDTRSHGQLLLRHGPQIILAPADISPCFFYQIRCRLIFPVNKSLINLLRVSEVEASLSPRDCDKCKAPLFLHSLSGGSLLGREHPLLHGHQKDMRKFKALGSVNCHELDGFAACGRVGIGKQRDMVQVISKQGFLPACRLVLINRLPKLRKIIEPLLAALRPQSFLVAALFEDRCDKLRDRHIVAALFEIRHHVEEFPGSGPSEKLLFPRTP